MIVVWSYAAIGDLEEIRSYVGSFNPRAAENIAARLINAGNSLVTFPHRGRPASNSELRELVAVYAYIIRYRIDDNRVVILRVRHGRRRA